MQNLFKKAAVFTDLHLGLKSNSKQHNDDCENFIDWFIEESRKDNCETGLFLGDWHHSRASISMQTLHYSVRCVEKLSKAFDNFYFIPGNHDQFYRNSRDVHGVEWAKHFPNVHICNDWVETGNCVIAPWLVGEDWKKLRSMGGKYLFSHLELPHFLMNARVEMPDHGELQSGHLTGFEKIFSGHFHKRQCKNNVWYIGNAFPHNYSDAGDDDRGMMILEWGGEPVFQSWPGQPRYRVYNLSEVLENPEATLVPDSHVRVSLDITISYEEANFIRETLVPQYKLREMTLVPLRMAESESQVGPQDLKFESVDQIVMACINSLDGNTFDRILLKHIYDAL